MTGTSASISLDDGGLQDAFRRLIALGENPAPMLQDIGDMAVTNVERRFFDEAGPGGAPWKPSLRVQKTGGKTLTLTPRLAASFSAVVEGLSVRWGTNVEYAAAHQFGATIRPKTKSALRFQLPGMGWVTVKSVTLPARPFLGWDREDERAAGEVARDHLERAVAGAGSTGGAP